ncbi:C-factor [uncultured bacterium]|nr:C-factor [uncultured bacterium]
MTQAIPQVLVTGANRGLGLEFVKQYLADGWRVIACCRNPLSSSALIAMTASAGGRLSVRELDVADFGQVERLSAILAGESIDVLINNAGFYPEGEFGQVDYADWEAAFRINTMAPMKMAECFVEQVACSQQRKIVTLSSKMGSVADNGSGGSYIYRSSKTAVNMVMKSLSIDLAGRGIAVGVLHPGWVLTDMGGPNALINVTQSVSGLRQVIAGLTLENAGRFIAYDGKEIPW